MARSDGLSQVKREKERRPAGKPVLRVTVSPSVSGLEKETIPLHWPESCPNCQLKSSVVAGDWNITIRLPIIPHMYNTATPSPLFVGTGSMGSKGGLPAEHGSNKLRCACSPFDLHGLGPVQTHRRIADTSERLLGRPPSGMRSGPPHVAIRPRHHFLGICQHTTLLSIVQKTRASPS